MRAAGKGFLETMRRNRQGPQKGEFICGRCSRIMKRGPYACGLCDVGGLCLRCRNDHRCSTVKVGS